MKNLKLNSTAQSFDSHSEFIILKKNFSSFNANPTPIPSTTTPTGKIWIFPNISLAAEKQKHEIGKWMGKKFKFKTNNFIPSDFDLI